MKVVGLVLVVSMAALAVRGRYVESITLFVVVGLSEVVVQIAKVLVDRPRPGPGALVEAAGFSYPSGHAAASLALYGGLGVVLARGRSRPAGLADRGHGFDGAAGRRAVLLAFVDDHSRLLVGWRWDTGEDVFGLEAALGLD